ncbi:acyl carrier protein [Streptomyces rochei]|uniref:acyl carrier protein n=1 Tax=Streptomyces rochei TaxID=1928 RepID=UPI00368663D9
MTEQSSSGDVVHGRNGTAPGMDADELARRVTSIVLEIAADPLDDAHSYQADDLLPGLDSLALVAVMVRLEAECGVTVASHEVVRENFQSVAAVCELVRSKVPYGV